MIRKAAEPDIATVAEIWLETNLKAHSFIASKYWRSHFEAVREMISQAEVCVYEDKDGIQGFIGLDNDFIAGLFVREESQSGGIGGLLLDFVKDGRSQLTLNVYKKNTRAVKFYLRENFQIQCEKIDEAAGEKEYLMIWHRR